MQYNRFVAQHLSKWERLKWLYAQAEGVCAITFTAQVGQLFSGLSLRLHPKTEADQAALDHWVELTRSTQGELYVHQEQLHMTLAYKLPKHKVDHDKLVQLRQALADLFENVDVVVDAPQVCVSKSMIDFQPVQSLAGAQWLLRQNYNSQAFSVGCSLLSVGRMPVPLISFCAHPPCGEMPQ